MKKLLLLSCLLAALSNSQAQDTLLLTFEEAVEIGLQRNQTYQIQRNEQELLKREKQAATAAFFPSVNINNSFSQQSGQQSQLVEGEYIFTTISNRRISSGLNAELPIYSGGRIVHRRQAAGLLEEAGQYNLERGAQEVVFQVA